VSSGPAAVVLDLDGVVIDSEGVWEQVREDYARRHGGRWQEGTQAQMMGMSTAEWATFMHTELGVPQEPDAIAHGVIEALLERYRAQLPLLPGAAETVASLAEHWPLGLASSSPRDVVDAVLDLAGIAGRFRAVVSSDEVATGKPAPDVYLEAARRLGVAPTDAVAVEDSTNGIRAAHAAGLAVVAVPNAGFPPADDALTLAAARVPGVAAVTPEVVREAARGGRPSTGARGWRL
jgi:HAD superfamily hydrolase (TIGR01509 family)